MNSVFKTIRILLLKRAKSVGKSNIWYGSISLETSSISSISYDQENLNNVKLENITSRTLISMICLWLLISRLLVNRHLFSTSNPADQIFLHFFTCYSTMLPQVGDLSRQESFNIIQLTFPQFIALNTHSYGGIALELL